MQTTSIHFLSKKECPYTFNGADLVGMRLVKLRQIAKALKVNVTIEDNKNDILHALRKHLEAKNADEEITELIKK